MAISLSSVPISPMIGLLVLSLSPPHPKMQINFPLVSSLRFSKIFFKLSGV